jgi:3-oxo-5alpha-steroid 4-dehydrogenase
MGEPSSWDAEYDVVVVGFGGAGASAAIEAAQDGARVLVLERFERGGATCRSGGVVYAGGGTPTQAAAGVADDAEAMRRYLGRELLGQVPEPVLRAFCDASLDNVRWLGELGVSFPGKLFTGKTTQPPDGFGLYFSGNERQLTPEAPAPRGHVTSGTEMAGGKLFAALRAAAERLGVTVETHTPVTGLVTDAGGEVIGVEARSLGASPAARALQRALFGAAFAARRVLPALRRVEATMGTPRRVRARGGVVLAAGGFMFDDAMVVRHAPAYRGCIPLGTPGDDGSGIRLGVAAGAATAAMDCCAATRFHCTPESLAAGVAVNRRGVRFCDESLYGAAVNREITKQEGGRAWLVIDQALHDRARAEMAREPSLLGFSLRDLASSRSHNLIYRKATAALNLNLNRARAGSLADLARRVDVPADALVATVEEHNARVRRGEPDAFGKPDAFRGPVLAAPFYAIDLRLANLLFPAPCFTLGGLRIDHLTARVLREDGTAIPGLYAAGRATAGVCAASYVSGLSIADAIFAGRNAGRDARRRAQGDMHR